MRIAQVGDIHIYENRFSEFEEMLDYLADEIIKEKPDLFVFTGDLFIHRDKLVPKQVEIARTFFLDKLKDIQKLIIVGNHDISMSANKIDSISAIFKHSSLKVHTKVGEYVDINDYRFHLFPYLSKSEMERLNVKDIIEVSDRDDIFDMFVLEENKKNVLVYHGTLLGFDVAATKSSEELINIGKDLYLPERFWGKFDAVMAGHLHRYQTKENAVYSGVPFPLTFADDYQTGFVLWNDLEPEFCGLKQKYKYITINLGDFALLSGSITDEAVRRVKNDNDYTNCRVKIKYTIGNNRSGELDHSKITIYFKGAKDIKVVPNYIDNPSERHTAKITLDDFQDNTVFKLILRYIDRQKYSPRVKDVAKTIEDKIKEKYSAEESQGIHFRLKTLNIGNFKAFGPENPVIKFDELSNIIGVFGPNKTGKSSLLESIIWGLFGTTPRNKDIKSIIRNGQDECFVEVTFVSYDTLYKIERKRNNNSGSLKFFYFHEDEWVDISSGTVLETQKAIENKIGNYDLFISTVYSPQNEIDLLIKKKPADRKQIILDCLQLDVLEKRNKEIQNIKKKVKDTIINLKGSASTYSDQINKLLNKKPNEMLRKFEDSLIYEKKEKTKINARLGSLVGKLHSYEDLTIENIAITKEIAANKTEANSLQMRILNKRKEYETYQDILSNQKLIDQKIQEIRDTEKRKEELNNLRNAKVELQSRISLLNKETGALVKEYKTRIKDVEETVELLETNIRGLKLLDCPRGDCPLNDKVRKQKEDIRIEIDKLEDKIVDLKTEMEIKVAEKRERVYELDAEKENLGYDPEEYTQIIRFLSSSETSKWLDLDSKTQTKDGILSTISELIISYETRLEELREKQKALVDKRSALAEKISSISRYKKEVEKLQGQIIELDENISYYEQKIFEYKRDIQDISNLQEQLTNTRNKIDDKENYLTYCNKYAEIISKNGVIYSMVDKALPVLENFAQNLLNETTNGLVSISIDSYKLLAKGVKTDEVSIWMSDAKGKRDVNEASGSELVLISLVLRAAMSYLLSMRTGSKVELFIVDEGFGAFDDENILLIKELLRKLSVEFNKMLYITHVSELKDVAESKINVSTNSIVSTFTVEE